MGLFVGVASIVLSIATALTTQKALLGGAYIKDGYRYSLLAAGAILAALSLIEIVVSMITSVDQKSSARLRLVIILLGSCTAIGGIVIYAGYRHEEDMLSQNNSPRVNSFSPGSGNTANTATSGSDASGTGTENMHCPDVQFTSPYTNATATARVAIREGNVSCAEADSIIARSSSTRHAEEGTTWSWNVDGWQCSSGGDGTVDVCAESGEKIESTTPTAGGYWAQP